MNTGREKVAMEQCTGLVLMLAHSRASRGLIRADTVYGLIQGIRPSQHRASLIGSAASLITTAFLLS